MIVAPPAFTPGLTQELVVGAASSSLALASDSPLVRLVMVGGTAGELAFIRVGTGSQTATVNDYPIPANVEVFINKGVGANTIAVLGNAAAVGALLYVTTGG